MVAQEESVDAGRIHAASEALTEAVAELATARAMTLGEMAERGQEKLDAGAVERYVEAREKFDALVLTD